MIDDVELLYRQHLTDADRRLLHRIAGGDTGTAVALGSPEVEAAIFEGPPGDERLVQTSPFLTFAVAVHRTAAHLETTGYVEERWIRRTRIPIFDVAPLRELLADQRRRFFLVELLASYTHISSGATWERTRHGWRRHRFSELDPVRLAGLLEVVDPVERPGVYRRLGDLALFLTGVFPDHRITADIGPAQIGRLLRLSGAAADTEANDILELLGPRWYRMAAKSALAVGAPATAGLALVEEMGGRFADARRVLTTVTDRYLYPLRERWFGV